MPSLLSAGCPVSLVHGCGWLQAGRRGAPGVLLRRRLLIAPKVHGLRADRRTDSRARSPGGWGVGGCRGLAHPRPHPRAAPRACPVARLHQLGTRPEAGQAPAWSRGSASSAPVPRPARRPPGRAAPPAPRRSRGRPGARLVARLHQLGADPEAGQVPAWWRGSASSAPVPRSARRPPGGAAPPARRAAEAGAVPAWWRSSARWVDRPRRWAA
jgi:hypothetical protein